MSLPLLRLSLLLIWLLPAITFARSQGVPLTPVSLQLKWFHQFQFAGYYAALEKNFYADAGLAVTIREGSPKQDPIDEVVGGKADFGIGASELILARGNGKPVVILASIIQHSPLILLSRAGPGVQSFHDLVGKTIEFVPHEYELFALFQAMGYTRDAFKLVPRAGDLDTLLSGEAAAIAAYSTDEPFALSRHGIPYLAISPRSAGIDFYGDSLFTREELVTERPETVAAFRRASLRGWEYALAHPEEIATLIQEKYRPQRELAHLLYEARTLRSLILPDLVELGYINRGRWKHIVETYRQLDLLDSPVDLQRLLYTSDTTRDLGWLYWTAGGILLLALLITLIAIYILRLNRRLHASEERYRVLYESAPMAIIVWDEQRHITAWNRQAEKIFGWTAQEALGRDFFDFMIPADEAGRVDTAIARLHNTRHPSRSINWNFTKDGRRILCEWMNDALEGGSGKLTEVVALAMDITEQDRIQHSLRESEQRYRLLAENAIDVIWTMDLDGRLTYVSPSVEGQRGYSVKEVLAQGLDAALAPDSCKRIHEALEHLQQTGELLNHHWELEQNCKDGTTLWSDVIISVVRDDDGTPLQIVGITRDATQRRKLEKRLHSMAHYDDLTGLPNRTLFFDRLNQALGLAGRSRQRLGLLFIDLDGFKRANDQHGHAYGDRLLQEVAGRLQGQIRSSDTVARMGGDEFAVILHQIGSRADCERVASALLESIALPFLIGEHPSRLGASIGISLYPEDSKRAEPLLNMADKAMYAVKRDGKHNFRFFSS